MDIRTALLQGTKLSGRLTAEVLLCHALHVEKPYLYTYPEQQLSELEWLHYGRYLHERLAGKPTQYITKKQEFYGRVFRVTPDVLIPRPETEFLVEAGLKYGSRAGGRQRIVDAGTGSGAIAVTLALELGVSVLALDLSLPALQVANGNASRLGASIFPLQGDLLSAFADKSMELVVSNPPYIGEGETVQPEVRDWEPGMALFAGRDGLAIYRRLIPQARRVLRTGGHLALELGYQSLEPVRELTRDWHIVEVVNDLAGIPRVIVCQKR